MCCLPAHGAMGNMGGVFMITSLNYQKIPETCVFSAGSLPFIKVFIPIISCMRALLGINVPTALFLLHVSMLHIMRLPVAHPLSFYAVCASPCAPCNHLGSGGCSPTFAASFRGMVYGGNTS